MMNPDDSMSEVLKYQPPSLHMHLAKLLTKRAELRQQYWDAVKGLQSIELDITECEKAIKASYEEK